ncbi:MAG: Rieske 2Fe-2S domain-containing protein [Caldilineaceae bacterium]|nr:Rieske 2Fe-2S domain-containing protein [Caldilineaceae bacterium]
MPDGAPSQKPKYCAAQVDEIPPGGRKLVEIDGKSIGLFNVNGAFIAVLNLCPHELAPVCLGRVDGTTLPSEPGEFLWGREGEILVCPWHGWEFDLLTGDALADRRRLRRYEVTVEDDSVFVTL